MSAPAPQPPLEVQASRHFLGWLHETGVSLAFTTYQTNRLFLLGLKPDGRLSIFERLFDRPMGLHATPDRLWMSTRWQLWRLDDALPPGETHEGFDRLYVPRRAVTTGDLDVHDVALDAQGRVVFVNTAYSCLATLSDRYSFAPLWKPPFVSRLAPEDRCHLNGLAMDGGAPRFVTAVSRSDVAGGWRERRHAGGCLVDVASGEIALGDLSMPHSPRVHAGRTWLLSSGTGELGYADLAAGRFEPVAFCPGFLRGLAIVGDYALVGLSKPRQERTFSGLALDERLREKDTEARCGIWVIDLRSGVVAHWLELAGVVVELYDVQVLPGVKRPTALGFKSDEIQRLVTIDVAPRPVFQPLSGAKRPVAAAVPTPPASTPPRDARRAEDLYRTANRLVQAQRFDEALAQYEEAVALDPRSEKALLNLGALLAQLGRDEEALAATQRAVAVAPASPRAQSNLAMLLQRRGDLAAALRALETACAAAPDDAALANQHGLVLYEDGRLADARAAFERAIALAPGSAEAYNNLAGVLKVEDRIAEALPLHEKAAQLRPDFVEALENVGKIHEDRCDVPAARLAYQRALAVRPNPVLELHRELLCSPVVPTTLALAAYRARAEEAIDVLAGTDLRIPLERIQSSRAEPPIEWAYHGASNLTLKTKHAALFDAYLPSPPLSRTPPKDGPWRVAFVVTPGHEGVFARCMAGILGTIDLARFQVAVACSRARAGAIAEAVRRPGIKWIHLPLRFDHAAERLRRAALDVIYYWEVGTDSTNHFLPFLRLAPVQCTGWGWPDTSGAPELDYHVTSEALAPRGCEAQYTEKVVRLPELPPSFARPPIPERPHGPAHFGIPEGGTRYVCAQSLRKIHPDFDALLGGVLRGDPNGVAVLVEDAHPAPGELLRARWRQTLPDVLDRIVLVPRLSGEDYFHLIAGADLFLDPLHFGGANTAYDALAAGVPIVTLPGVFPRGRYAAALSKAIGVEDGIAMHSADYVTRALTLGTDRALREQVSARIRDGAPRVFDAPHAARQLEELFEQALRAAHEGVEARFSFFSSRAPA